MRKGATRSSYPCRLITLLLILLYLVDAVQALPFKPDLGIDKSTDISNPQLEPTVSRSYMLLSRCSNMFVRIKPGGKRRRGGKRKQGGKKNRTLIDATGNEKSPYISIIMESNGPNGRVRLLGEKSQTYLCFSPKGKLKIEHHPISTCNLIYNETYDKYTQFRLEERQDWFVGFKRKRIKNSRKFKGKALPGYKKTSKRFERCYDFKLIPIHPIKHQTPFRPVNFNEYSLNYEPGEPYHKIRHMKKYEELHRKVLKLRHKNKRRKSKRKPEGS